MPSPDISALMNQKVGGAAAAAPSKPPRPIGTPIQEGKYIAEDVGQGMLQLLPDFMQDVLHTKPSDTPQEKAKKQQLLQNYTRLDSEQQQYVQKQMQAEHMKKQKEEEERMQKRQEEQKKAAESSLPEPKGKVSGAAAGMPGQSRKKSMIDDLNKKRQQLSSAG